MRNALKLISLGAMFIMANNLPSLAIDNAYLSDMSRRLRKGWGGNSEYDAVHGPVIRFKVEKTGLILCVVVHKSSGSNRVDDSFIRGVWNSSPMRPLPVGDNSAVFEVSFDFAKSDTFSKPKMLEESEQLSSADKGRCDRESTLLKEVVDDLAQGKKDKATSFFLGKCKPECIDLILAFNFWYAGLRAKAIHSDVPINDFFNAIPNNWLKKHDLDLEKAKSDFLVDCQQASSDTVFYSKMSKVFAAMRTSQLVHRPL